MKKLILLLTLMPLLGPTMAMAHPGHLVDAAGHDHLLAGAAIAIAIGVAIWGALRGRRDDETSDETDETDAEAQDA